MGQVGLSYDHIHNIEAAGYSIQFDERSRLWILGVENANSRTLEALTFDHVDGSGISQYSFHTPQTILRRLGEPTGIYTEFLETAPNAPVVALGRVLIIYERGIAFFLVFDMSITSNPEFCLNQELYDEEIYLIEPFNRNFAGLSEVQAALLTRAVDDYLPAVDVFEMNLAEITELAQTQENACLEIH
jgi:hypothetical protein